MIIVIVISLLALVALHELGHFFAAKKFGVKVEEFGIGIPPRIAGKKIGETIYSINLLPLGAFVRLLGEEKSAEDPRSYSSKPLWQRMVIVGAGVCAFWIVSVILFSALGASSGIPMAVGDETAMNISNPRVQITGVASGSPAKEAGLQFGDSIQNFNTVSQFQEFVNQHKGKEMSLQIQRKDALLDVAVTPRENPPEGEGPLGVGLARTALVKHPWYKAPVEGLVLTSQLTVQIVAELGRVVGSFVGGQGLPPGVQLTGPVGIVQLLSNSLGAGIPSFVSFLSLLSIYLAIFNLLPIPATDGGKLLFLGLESIRRKPLPEKFEKGITAVSFGLLIALLLWVTAKDLSRIF